MGTGDPAVNKADTSPDSMELTDWQGRGTFWMQMRIYGEESSELRIVISLGVPFGRQRRKSTGLEGRNWNSVPS